MFGMKLSLCIVTFCNKFIFIPKVLEKNADIKTVSKRKTSGQYRKGFNMRIENEMLSRFNEAERMNKMDTPLSKELDFFFDNVLDTVVDYFKEEVVV